MLQRRDPHRLSVQGLSAKGRVGITLFRCQNRIYMHDLTQATRDMFGNLGFKMLDLDIDLQFAESGMTIGDG